VNCYLLSSWVGRREKGSGLDRGQSEFRGKLISQLFELARAEAQKSKRQILQPKLPSLASSPEHIRVRRARGQDCWGCFLAGQERKPLKKQKVLGELSANQRPQKIRRSTIYSCEACDAPLCKEGPCWEAFHSQNNRFCE
jgi:hypothetical protein